MSPETTLPDHSDSLAVLDTGYWNSVYKTGGLPSAPSLFANYCQSLFQGRELTLIEAGCGNGRDSFYFAESGHQVTALDQSDEVIRQNQDLCKGSGFNLKFESDDFVSYLGRQNAMFDVIYSRFTLHAISLKQQIEFLEGCYQSLKTNGLLCIEVRTINDSLYGVGKDLGDNAFYSDHYRRFIDPEEMLSQLEQSSWEIKLFNEDVGYAPFQGEDPPVLRIVLEK